jgi:hypothetical protein
MSTFAKCGPQRPAVPSTAFGFRERRLFATFEQVVMLTTPKRAEVELPSKSCSVPSVRTAIISGRSATLRPPTTSFRSLEVDAASRLRDANPRSRLTLEGQGLGDDDPSPQVRLNVNTYDRKAVTAVIV